MTQVPWRRMHEFVLDCGSVQNHRKYCERILDRLDLIISFDTAQAYFLNDNGKVYDEYLLGVEKRWTDEYHSYYAHIDDGRYSVTKKEKLQDARNKTVEDCVSDWTRPPAIDEFFSGFILPQGIRHSLGFVLFDTYNTPKCVCIINRLSDTSFTQNELYTMKYIHAHLNNLHRNFYVTVDESSEITCTHGSKTPLTAREMEIARLVREGVTPTNISNKLDISCNTVTKHLASIRIKLNVACMQELVAKLNISTF